MSHCPPGSVSLRRDTSHPSMPSIIIHQSMEGPFAPPSAPSRPRDAIRPSNAARLKAVRRCFSNGCRESTLVHMSAVLSPVGMYFTVTILAPLISRILYIFLSICFECCAAEYLWHKSCAPLLSVSTSTASSISRPKKRQSDDVYQLDRALRERHELRFG